MTWGTGDIVAIVCVGAFGWFVKSLQMKLISGVTARAQAKKDARRKPVEPKAE